MLDCAENPKVGKTQTAINSATDYAGGSVVQQGTVTSVGFKVWDSPKSEHVSRLYSNGFNFTLLSQRLLGAEESRDEQSLKEL